ncbi:MAG TPA: hypothetical protein VND64_18585 [Pirellulales bacterium]|nr:hypothetical protein [Pirellulales bacterium]
MLQIAIDALVLMVDINQGMFRLWLDAVPKPLLTVPTHLVNFYPAYYLAMRLWQQSCRV